MNEKLLKITDTVSIRVPADLTPNQEAEIIARIRADIDDPERAEAELREVLEMDERGELVPYEQVLAELGIESTERRGDSA